MIASSTNRKLKQNIAKVLKNKPRILINTNGRVTQVNQYSVVDNNGVYVILDKEFTLKKTAVAYAIALVNGDSTLQNTIEQLNSRISKYAEDTQMYKQHIRKILRNYIYMHGLVIV